MIAFAKRGTSRCICSPISRPDMMMMSLEVSPSGPNVCKLKWSPKCSIRSGVRPDSHNQIPVLVQIGVWHKGHTRRIPWGCCTFSYSPLSQPHNISVLHSSPGYTSVKKKIQWHRTEGQWIIYWERARQRMWLSKQRLMIFVLLTPLIIRLQN